MLCSPPKSALLKAINNNQLTSFPGLTYDLIAKHIPPSTATDKVYMIHTRQGVRSTSSQQQKILDARVLIDDMHTPQKMCSALDDTMSCFAVLADQNDSTIYTDLAGRFP